MFFWIILNIQNKGMCVKMKKKECGILEHFAMEGSQAVFKNINMKYNGFWKHQRDHFNRLF